MQPAEKKYHDHAQLVIPLDSMINEQQAQQNRNDHHPQKPEFHDRSGIQGTLPALLGNTGKPKLANDPLNMTAAAGIQCSQNCRMNHKAENGILAIDTE